MSTALAMLLFRPRLAARWRAPRTETLGVGVGVGVKPDMNDTGDQAWQASEGTKRLGAFACGHGSQLVSTDLLPDMLKGQSRTADRQ